MDTNLDSQYRFGKDHIEVLRAGEVIRIEDRSVQGVSTRVLRSEKLMVIDEKRRVVGMKAPFFRFSL